MPQFFVSSISEDNTKAYITDIEDIKHISSVLRLRENDEILAALKDNFSFNAKISKINKTLVELKVISKNKIKRTLNTRITLIQSILKGQKQDLIIQKATELGVDKIIPIISKNTVVKLFSDKDKEQKIERWQKIAYESVKQCERLDVPIIENILTLKEALNLKDYDLRFVCAERNDDLTLRQFLTDFKKQNNNIKNILIIIGPEGGWSNEEFDLFNKENLPLISLGNLILRAETAVVSALSQVIYEYEL
ncbi:MAG: RsmE family RNA methyltransferase [bacterium]